MNFAPIDESVFPPERETKLKAITRYSMFDTVLYRPNLWEHQHRVLWIVEALIPHCGAIEGLDPEKARALAVVHDDAEILTGDVQAGHKAQMTQEELAALDRAEEAAVRELARTYPREVHGYFYEELLMHALRKDCVEVHLVSYADKFDGYCETLHEVCAGNVALLWSLMLYERWFVTWTERYPSIAALKHSRSPLVLGDGRHQPKTVRAADYQHLGKPHTPESIKRPTGFVFYDAWRTLVLENGGKEGERQLTHTREPLQQAGKGV